MICEETMLKKCLKDLRNMPKPENDQPPMNENPAYQRLVKSYLASLRKNG